MADKKKKDMGNMEYVIASDSINVNGKNTQISCAMMTSISRAVGKVLGLKKWEYIIEDVRTGETEPQFKLHLISSKGKGTSCADKKLYTLQVHSEIANTGELKPVKLPDNEVSWYGAIQVPYTGYETDENGESVPCSGIVRIIFSGAREGVDLGLVLESLESYEIHCDMIILDASYSFDKEGLRQDQFVRYMMDLLSA